MIFIYHIHTVAYRGIMKRRVTVKDIAEIAGVDHSTVSRALNDSPRVSEKTKARIQQIAREMDFAFNAAGRSLSRGKSGNIAVIHSGTWDGFGTSQYFNLLFRSLRRDLERHRMDALILEAYNPDTGKSNIERLIREQKVDGFLLVHPLILKKDYQLITDRRIPVVQLHSRPRYYRLEDIDYFITDNTAGGYLAAVDLLDKGCTRLIVLTASTDTGEEFQMRLDGFRQALEERGIPIDPNLILRTACSFQAGYQSVYAHQDLFRRADGVFAQADVVAFGALSALKELGITPPEDILITGFDDTPLCTITTPELSSVHQPVEELTARACQRIYQLLEGTADTSHTQQQITPWLVERGSTRYIQG